MSKIVPFIALLALLAPTAAAFAQSSGAPNFQNLSPQDAAKINHAMQNSDDATKRQLGEVEQRLKDANHPSAKMLEVTRP